MGSVIPVAFGKARKTAEELRKEEAEASLCSFKRIIEVTAFTASQCFGKTVVVGFLRELVNRMEEKTDRGA